MPFVNEGEMILGKHPSHIQIVLKTDKGTVYLPVKSFTWNKTTEQIGNHHSGSPQVSDLVEGAIDYDCSFSTSSWLTTVDAGTAELWEYLTYWHLVAPHNAGRSKWFDIYIQEAEYKDENNTTLGGGNITKFRKCKIRKMSYDQSENGIVKRNYECGCMRVSWGDIEEKGGQS